MFNKQLLYLLLMLVLTMGCQDKEQISNLTKEGKVSVNISLDLPKTKEVEVKSRNTSLLGDDIANIDLFVFDKNGTFVERVLIESDDISQVGDQVKFNTLLKASSTQRTIHFVVNARNKADNSDRLNTLDMRLNISKESDMLNLHTNNIAELTDASSLSPEIMWSKKVLDNLHINTQIDSVMLLRTSARVVVQKSMTSTSPNLANFLIEGITLYGAPLNSNLLPINYNESVVATPNASNAYTEGGTASYAKLWVNGSAPSIIVAERVNTEDNFMSIILKASYKGQSGFYRIALRKDNSLLEIVRNHRYNVSIIDVNNAGYSNVDDAIANPPSNALKVEILDSDPDYPIVIADATNKMSLTFNEAMVWSTRNDLQNIILCTVHSSNGSLPRVLTLPTWIKSIEAIPLGENQYNLKAHLNRGSLVKNEGEIQVRCGSLAANFKVIWSELVGGTKSISLVELENVYSNWSVLIDSDSANLLSLSDNPNLSNISDGFQYISSQFFRQAFLYIDLNQPLEGNAKLYGLKQGNIVSSNIIIR